MRRRSLADDRRWLVPEDHGHGLVHLQRVAQSCMATLTQSRSMLILTIDLNVGHIVQCVGGLRVKHA